ncbi:MAG: hypothetical protein KDE20_18515 [Caldilineaceae bacterium]|nr:hypothetical protein [Caldilineaceae bacterium]
MVRVEIEFENEQSRDDFLTWFRDGGFEDFAMGFEDDVVDYFELDEDSSTGDNHVVRILNTTD